MSMQATSCKSFLCVLPITNQQRIPSNRSYLIRFAKSKPSKYVFTKQTLNFFFRSNFETIYITRSFNIKISRSKWPVIATILKKEIPVITGGHKDQVRCPMLEQQKFSAVAPRLYRLCPSWICERGAQRLRIALVVMMGSVATMQGGAIVP